MLTDEQIKQLWARLDGVSGTGEVLVPATQLLDLLLLNDQARHVARGDIEQRCASCGWHKASHAQGNNPAGCRLFAPSAQ